MKAEIESIVCNWADEIPHILVRVINAITLSANERGTKDCRQSDSRRNGT